MVAHLTPTPTFLDCFGGIDRDLVIGLVALLNAKIRKEELDRMMSKRVDSACLG